MIDLFLIENLKKRIFNNTIRGNENLTIVISVNYGSKIEVL